MNLAPEPYTQELGRRATRRAWMRMRDTLRVASNMESDPDRERRLARGRCRWCHYNTTIAGAAMTQRPCGLCDKPQQYSSTAADVLCGDCASAHALCRHCGGDIDANPSRDVYPGAPQTDPY